MSLIETIIASLIITIILLAGTSLYLVGQKVWSQGLLISENTQNTRFIIDRLSRDIRQANEIVIVNAQELFFEDGHDDRLQYINYELEPDGLRRMIIVYKKNNNLVRYDTPGAQFILEQDELLADTANVSGLSFNYQNYLLEMSLNGFNTKIYPKNSR